MKEDEVNIGRKRKWTEELCLEKARGCSTKKEFYTNFTSAYQAAVKKGWYDGYTWLIDDKDVSPKGTWTEEKCRDESKKYKKQIDFKNRCPGAYKAAKKNGWIDSYAWLSRRESVWTYDRCMEESKKYDSRMAFCNGNATAYQKSIKKDWINSFTWLGEGKTTKKWNRTTCMEEAAKYDSLGEFIKNSHQAYWVAKKNGWIDGYTWKVSGARKRTNHPTKDMCREEAAKYKSRGEFSRWCHTAYVESLENGWLEEFFGAPLKRGRKRTAKK